MDRLSFMVGLRVGLALGRGGEFGIRNAEFEIAGDGAAAGEAPSVSLAADSSLWEGADKECDYYETFYYYHRRE